MKNRIGNIYRLVDDEDLSYVYVYDQRDDNLIGHVWICLTLRIIDDKAFLYLKDLWKEHHFDRDLEIDDEIREFLKGSEANTFFKKTMIKNAFNLGNKKIEIVKEEA